jgi:penicillin V acylase-like amidase (Ntn superfamily)
MNDMNPDNKRSLLHLIFAVGLATIVSRTDIYACTTFSIDKSNRATVGRSYDYEFEEGLLFVNKRDQIKTAYAYLGESTGSLATWKSKYGSITFNQYGRDIALSGTNEAGLVVSLLSLDGTQYPYFDARPSIDAGQYVQYLLDNFGTVEETIASDSSIRVRPSPGNNSRLHFFVVDDSGESATIDLSTTPGRSTRN